MNSLNRGGVIPASSILMGTLALAACASTAAAATVPVLNNSFELPATAFVNPQVDSWQKTPQPAWFDPAQTGGVTWDQMSGVFANTAPDKPDHIDNIDANQALFIIALPTAGLTQQLDAKFEAGMAYKLTVGVIGGGGGMPEGTGFMFELFALDSGNNPKALGEVSFGYSAASFPTTTHFVDVTMSTLPVQAGDAWAGKNIGVMLAATSGQGVGYWDLDNVRVTATAVPEPSTWSLLAIGIGGLSLAAWRSRRRS